MGIVSMYVVSRCLLGINCKYNGRNNLNEDVIEFCRNHSVIAVCPETAGKLESPRPPAEHQLVTMPDGSVEERVIDKDGKDRTANFFNGANISMNEVLRKCESTGETIEGAILKANSPSCGSDMIYDGTFAGVLIPGDGIFAGMLKERNVPVMSEKNFKERLNIEEKAEK